MDIAVLIVYCSYSKYADNVPPWSNVQNAVFEALSRPFWALCVAWVVFACYNGRGGNNHILYCKSTFIRGLHLVIFLYLNSRNGYNFDYNGKYHSAYNVYCDSLVRTFQEQSPCPN